MAPLGIIGQSSGRNLRVCPCCKGVGAADADRIHSFTGEHHTRTNRKGFVCTLCGGGGVVVSKTGLCQAACLCHERGEVCPNGKDGHLRDALKR